MARIEAGFEADVPKAARTTLADKVDRLELALQKVQATINELDEQRDSHQIRIFRVEEEVGLAPRNTASY